MTNYINAGDFASIGQPWTQVTDGAGFLPGCGATTGGILSWPNDNSMTIPISQVTTWPPPETTWPVDNAFTPSPSPGAIPGWNDWGVTNLQPQVQVIYSKSTMMDMMELMKAIIDFIYSKDCNTKDDIKKRLTEAMRYIDLEGAIYCIKHGIKLPPVVEEEIEKLFVWEE